MKRKTAEEIKSQYCRSKCRDLRAFGYTDLTLAEVEEQYDKVLAKETKLTVIGLMIEDDFQRASK